MLTSRDFAPVVVRALRSTLVIFAVALVVISVRRDGSELSATVLLVAKHWFLWLTIFTAAAIWEFWSAATKAPGEHSDE